MWSLAVLVTYGVLFGGSLPNVRPVSRPEARRNVLGWAAATEDLPRKLVLLRSATALYAVEDGICVASTAPCGRVAAVAMLSVEEEEGGGGNKGVFVLHAFQDEPAGAGFDLFWAIHHVRDYPVRRMPTISPMWWLEGCL